jgi:hypothetical protein
MKSRIFWLALAPAAVISPAALATTYLTVEQAQAVMFPGAGFAPDFHTLTDTQMAAIERESGVNVRNREVKVWRVSTGGWFIADDVVGKHEFITFAVGLDAGGR